MTEIVWEYENSDGGDYEPIEDPRIEGFYKNWLHTGKETGIVYHCFGDGMTTGVCFGSMTTHCLCAHICNIHLHNRYPIRRTHRQQTTQSVSPCFLL